MGDVGGVGVRVHESGEERHASSVVGCFSRDGDEGALGGADGFNEPIVDDDGASRGEADAIEDAGIGDGEAGWGCLAAREALVSGQLVGGYGRSVVDGTTTRQIIMAKRAALREL